MPISFLSILLIQIFVGILVLIVALLIIRQYYAIKIEKRFEPFSLSTNNDQEQSVLDKLSVILWMIIHKVSKFLNYSAVLTKYSKKYECHIISEEKNEKKGIDYVAIKFLVGLLFVLLNLVTVALKKASPNPMSYLIIFLIGFYAPDIFLTFSFKKKQKRVEEDLLKAIIIMNNSFKSGRNIMQAVSAVKNELTGPIADEFEKIYLDITYGLSIEVVFNRFYDRIKLDDARYIASSLTLLNKTGGNIVRVFATIEKSIFDRKKLRSELKSLTAASVFVFRFLVALPFIFVFVIYCLNPSYFLPLFTNPLGIFFLLLIILLFGIYIVVIKNVLKVKIK